MAATYLAKGRAELEIQFLPASNPTNAPNNQFRMTTPSEGSQGILVMQTEAL
jgi:hypothetical protein